jgi:hypothetical protein
MPLSDANFPFSIMMAEPCLADEEANVKPPAKKQDFEMDMKAMNDEKARLRHEPIAVRVHRMNAMMSKVLHKHGGPKYQRKLDEIEARHAKKQ